MPRKSPYEIELSARERVHLWVACGVCVGVVMIGPVDVTEATLSLTPSLSVSEQYTDNLLLSQTSKVGDLATFVSPRLSLESAGRDVVWGGGYQGTAEYYRQRPDENRYSQTATAHLRSPRLTHALGGLDLRLAGSLIRTSELQAYSYTQPLGESNEGIRVPRVDTRRTRMEMTVDYPWSQRTTAALSSSLQTTRYGQIADQGSTGGTIQLQDSTVSDGAIRLRHQWSATTTLTADSGVSVTVFDVPEAGPLVPGPDHIRTQRLTAGAEYVISSATTINGSAGVTWVEDDRSRLTTDLGVRRALRAGSLAVQYTRGAGTGGGLSRTVTISQRATGRLAKNWGERTTGYVQLGWSRSVSTLTSSVKISSYEAGAGLDVALLPWLGGGFSYSYFNQRSQGGTGDAERHLLMVILTATGPPWELSR